jgi:membrane protease YdiL (CAAX protease family)
MGAMYFLIVAPFAMLILGFISLWIRREARIWGSLLGLTLLLGVAAGNILWPGAIILAALIAMWTSYAQTKNSFLFWGLIALTLLIKLRIMPGFEPVFITPKFALGLEGPILGLLPLALLVPLAKDNSEWRQVAQGTLIGFGGIALLAIAATMAHVVHWDAKLPSYMAIRTVSNFFFTSIPEEGFYRGFLQAEIARYFKSTLWGKIAALFLTSIVFTAAHIFWSPNLAIIGFVFLASLLYGSVYLISKRIESAIIVHFALNLVHMTFFQYHAM